MTTLQELYADGKYPEIIQTARNNLGSSFNIDNLSILFSALIKANYIDQAIHTYNDVLMHFPMIATSMPPEQQTQFGDYLFVSPELNLLRQSCTLMSNINAIKGMSLAELGIGSKQVEIEEFFKTINDNKSLIIPYVWPNAYGDSIIMCQFIKLFAIKNPDKQIIILTPLNRPELKSLYNLIKSDQIKILDLTIDDQAEADRNKTLVATFKGNYILALQERIISKIIKELRCEYQIVKLRYLPVLNEFPYIAGKRIWEERAEMYLNHSMELPKIIDQKTQKRNKITLHFREADYSDKNRNISKYQAQDLINELKKLYPDYELVRLGDENMSRLLNCRNASHESLSIEQQIYEIQESKLFIGCHSAPQHLAVACSDTPIICINYMCQETTTDMKDNIARLSYEPIGNQVKKIFYNNCYLKGELQIPRQHGKYDDVKTTTNEEILAAVKEILG